MVILLTGATGFIGRRLVDALAKRSHRVIVAGRRRIENHPHIPADFACDCRVEHWTPRLDGVDVVVNSVGIFREQGTQTFARLHTETPKALFKACELANVRRVIQLSALGADTGCSAYFRSKHAADEVLASSSLKWTIVQPSVVYGTGGTSSRLFTTLAALPVIPLPGSGCQRLQPVHIDDLVEGLVSLCESEEFAGCRCPVVGPRPISLRDLLVSLRRGLGFTSARTFRVPMWLVHMAAGIASLSPRSLFDRESLAMLEAGNTADPRMTMRLLGRTPRDVSGFVSGASVPHARLNAQLNWLLPVLRFSIAFVWLWTAVVSLWGYPRAASYALLARSGVSASLQPLFLYGAIACDFVLGFATLMLRRRAVLWIAQGALIVIYTVIITARLPEYWLHPYGPLSKNIPMLAALWLLYTLEKTQWNTSS